MQKAQSGLSGNQWLNVRIEGDSTARFVMLEAPSGEVQKGSLRLSLNPADIARALSTATQYTDGTTRRGGSYDMHDPLRDLGDRLFSALFEGRRESLYRRTMQDARQAGARVILRIGCEERSLAQIPWEFLYDGQDFVGLSSWSAIVREPSFLVDIPSLATLDSIRMLVLAADITGAMQTNEEISRIMSLTKRYPQLHVEVDVDVTRQRLLDVLDREPYHILHFIGTGVDMGSSEQALALLTDPNQPVQMQAMTKGSGDSVTFDYLQPQALHTVLQTRQQELRLIVLSACKTDVLAATLADVAPATIGMRGDISTSACIVFSDALYRGLVTGKTIEQSTAQARQEIDVRLTGSREWGLPVAYMHQLEGPLWASLSSLSTSESVLSIDEPESAPPVVEANLDDWKKFDILARIYQKNLQSLQDQAEAYSDQVPEHLSAQIFEAEERLEQARRHQRDLSE